MIIVKVPGVNGLGRTDGTRDAGTKILEGFGSEYKYEEIHVDNGDLREQDQLIRKNSEKLFENEDKVIFIGGDHSVSYPLVEGFKKFYPQGKLVIFDAHADCMISMPEPTHEEWLNALIESGFSGKNVMIVGLNRVEPEEKRYLEEKGVKLSEDASELREFVKEGKVYVSFDIDVFKDVKATGFPEGKMSESDVMKLVDVANEGDVVGMDLVEVNLDKDGLDETIRLARKVLKKFIEK